MTGRLGRSSPSEPSGTGRNRRRVRRAPKRSTFVLSFWPNQPERYTCPVRPDLRDYFAIQFATALTREQRYSLEFISGRAYDLAEAMIAERDRRIRAELSAAQEEDAHL